MDEERLGRYAAKLDHARNRLRLFQEWVPDADTSTQALLASYKAFQEVAEAVLDVVAMVLKDAGIPPKDDYHNLERLAHERILTDVVAKRLAEVNGLRNRLVHEYNGLWDDVAIESAVALVGPIQTAMEVLQAWMAKNS